MKHENKIALVTGSSRGLGRNIALQLAQGKTTETIAQERKVVVGTVRAQIKSLLSKLGVNRQVELVATLNEF